MMFDIIVDTREQHPLSFSGANIGNIIRRKLDTGDYSLDGLEDRLCIERKSNVAEFYQNVTQKRFWEEMERVKSYPHRFLLFEFSVSDVEMFPYGSGLPKSITSKLKISPAYLMKCIAKLQVSYNIHIIFAGSKDNASSIATVIMKEIYEKYQK